MRLKIVADNSIPFLKGIAEPEADVVYLDAGSFNAAAVRDADALIIRSIDKCTPALLEGSSVKLDHNGHHRLRPHRHGFLRTRRHHLEECTRMQCRIRSRIPAVVADHHCLEKKGTLSGQDHRNRGRRSCGEKCGTALPRFRHEGAAQRSAARRRGGRRRIRLIGYGSRTVGHHHVPCAADARREISHLSSGQRSLLQQMLPPTLVYQQLPRRSQ